MILLYSKQSPEFPLGYGSKNPFNFFFYFFIKLDQNSSTDFKLHQKIFVKKSRPFKVISGG